MLTLTQRFLFCILVSLAFANKANGNSDTPLSFQNIETYSVSSSTGQAIENSRREIDTSYPSAIWVRLVSYLPQRFELHAQVKLNEESDSLTPIALSVYLPATFELYWNERLIGKNGELTPNGSETIAGNSYTTFSIPTPLEIGEVHNLRIRGYHTHSEDSNHALILSLQSLDGTLAKARSIAVLYSLYIGFALFGIYLLAYYIINRDRHQYLLLGLTCLLFGLYAVNKLVYYQLQVPYTHLDWIGLIANSINNTLSVIGPITLLFILGWRKILHYPIALTPLIISHSIDSIELLPATTYLCTIISLSALFLRKTHALQSLVVSLLLLATYELPPLRDNQAFGFGALILFFLVSIIRLLISESHQRNQAQLRNTRLKLELLKSKVQPHFVLNSLTSAIEWIETNPKQGSKFIAELAREFDLLSNIADEPLIPVATEIESCRTYLRIMEYRKKGGYELTLIDVQEQDTLPPAVLRNLLENALTHNAYREENIVFELKEARSKHERSLTFTAPYLGHETSAPPDGTGIQYVKARLDEAYSQWSFHHGPSNGNWITTISIPTQN